MGGLDCHEPCTRTCQLDVADVVALEAATVEVDCSGTTPMLTGTIDLSVRAPTSGGDLELSVAVTEVQLEKEVSGFSCRDDGIAAVSVGPLSAGAEEPLTFRLGPVPCGDPSSSNPRYHTCDFGYCTEGEAWINVQVTARAGTIESSIGTFLKTLSSGARVPVRCSGP